MADPSTACRLVIATLEVPEPLRAAVAEISARNILPDRIGIAGTAATFDELRGRTFSHAEPALLPLLETAPLGSLEDGTIYATSRNWLTELKAAPVTASPGKEGARCLLDTSLRQGLVKRMLQGEVMLFAGPLTSSEQSLVTRVLLRHSNHHVQSHTFAPPYRP